MTDIRRIVIGQLPNGEIKRISDGIAEDIITDNVRPGYKSTKIWATLRSPANLVMTRKRKVTVTHTA